MKIVSSAYLLCIIPRLPCIHGCPCTAHNALAHSIRYATIPAVARLSLFLSPSLCMESGPRTWTLRLRTLLALGHPHAVSAPTANPPDNAAPQKAPPNGILGRRQTKGALLPQRQSPLSPSWPVADSSAPSGGALRGQAGTRRISVVQGGLLGRRHCRYCTYCLGNSGTFKTTPRSTRSTLPYQGTLHCQHN